MSNYAPDQLPAFNFATTVFGSGLHMLINGSLYTVHASSCESSREQPLSAVVGGGLVGIVELAGGLLKAVTVARDCVNLLL